MTGLTSAWSSKGADGAEGIRKPSEGAEGPCHDLWPYASSDFKTNKNGGGGMDGVLLDVPHSGLFLIKWIAASIELQVSVVPFLWSNSSKKIIIG